MARSEKDRGNSEAEFLALRAGGLTRLLSTSAVIDGLDPSDVQEAMGHARFGETKSERIESIAPVVRKRRQRILRIREETPSYPVGSSKAIPYELI